MDTQATAEAPPLERRIRIAARPETVFRFFVEPDRLVAWMGKVATLDPHPGGAFRLDYGGGDVVRGEYLEVDPPRRVAFSWGWEAEGDPVPPGTSRVEVDFEPDGDGTLLTLRHLGLPAEAVDGHGEGWDHFLGRLGTAVAAAG